MKKQKSKPEGAEVAEVKWTWCADRIRGRPQRSLPALRPSLVEERAAPLIDVFGFLFSLCASASRR
jgi:hypothetical protein